METVTRPVLYLVKNEQKPKRPRHAPCKGSSVVIEVESGQLRENLVNALSNEDAIALLGGLAMAIVQVIRASQNF